MTGQKARALLKALYALICTGVLLYGGYSFFQLNRQLWLLTIQLNLAILIGSSIIVLVTMNLFDAWLGNQKLGFLEWRLFARNINFVVLDYKLLRVPFIVGLYINLPLLALLEESIFRDGWFGTSPTVTIYQALWRSFLFGFAHILGGCPVRECTAIILGGLWFSYVYVHFGTEGLIAATIVHFSCNALELTYRLGQWVYTGKNPFQQRAL